MAEDEVDIEAILARLNASHNEAEETDDITKEAIPQNEISINIPTHSVEKNSPLKDDSPNKEQKIPEIRVVRHQAEDKESPTKKDVLAEHADIINLSPAIMNEPDKYLSLLDSQPLSAMFDSIRATFASNSQVIIEKQKEIIEQVAFTAENSSNCLNYYLPKSMNFGKLKPEDMQKKLEEVKNVIQETQNLKDRLVFFIKDLEDLEGKVDNLLFTKARIREENANKKDSTYL